MGEVIVITSGKGGVGKTTTTANVGAGLSKLGKKVVIIDTDLGLRNLDVVMGMENLVVYNLVDVVTGGCRLKQALIRDSRYENLYLLPSAQTKDKSAVSPEQMKKLASELKEEFDAKLNPKQPEKDSPKAKEDAKKKTTKKVVTSSKKSKGKVRTGVDSILPVVGGVAVVAAIALIFTRKKNK